MTTNNIFHTRTDSERGAWLHLVDPATGKPAYFDDDPTMPMRVKLRGPTSDEWQIFLKQTRQRDYNTTIATTGEGRHGVLDAIHDDAQHDAELWARMTLAVENLPWLPESPTHEQLAQSYLEGDQMRAQAQALLMDKQRFLRLARSGG